jgi:CBS domain-containing protein
MAAAGPLMSFSLSLFFWLLARLGEVLYVPTPLLAITDYLVMVNLFVGLFNLIPGFPLDGGRILRAILWARYGDVRKATAISSALGKAFAFFLIGYGFISLITGAVISGIWFIFIGLFLEEAADLSYRQVAMKKLLTGVAVEKLMTKDVVTVNANVTLDKLVDDYFFKYRYTTFPVIEDDTLLGLVTIHDLKSVPREQWPQLAARQVVMPITPALVIDKKADAVAALAKMSASGLGRLLVIENSKLIGILSQRDIMRLFEFKSEVGG